MSNNLTIEQYLDRAARFCDSEYANLIRTRFADCRGSSELAVLVAPTSDELTQLKKAVAIMTSQEKLNAHLLTDEQVSRIAADAQIDPALFAIFINGYTLHQKTPQINA